ncbi:efflux RND transporter periplasmic adaptor subunit [Alicycliphilus denitrificans]|uniref:efflux RND transporter periplasmic adaptor subunit n=1 Tax=Alicycliphilus denitrificans TaxID=179636 RepID=UPI00384FAF85
MKHSSLIALAALGLLAAGGALLAGGPSRAAPPAPAASAPRPALTVSTTAPRRETLARRLPANGNVAPWQEASIGSESNGLRLAEVLVNVGDPVRAGQLLARFAADTVQADLAQARASLQEARAALAQAQANAERAHALNATGAMSQQEIQQYASAAQAAQARMAAAQAAVDTQRLRLAHTEVRAPDAGVISARQATVGAVAGAGTELFRMLRRGRLEWRAEVGSSDLPRLRPGTAAVVTAASGAQVEGRVRVLAPTVDQATRNALVYVDLPAHPDIRAGMFARGEFLLGRHEALTVPLSAVVVRDGFSHLFEVGADGRVHMRRVQTGQRVDGRVEITEGLAPETRIVQQGGAFLNDGDLVRVATESEPKQVPASTHKAPTAIK